MAPIVAVSCFLFTVQTGQALASAYETSSGYVEVDESNYFKISFDDDGAAGMYRSFGAGMCTGTFAGPRLEAGGIIGYSLHVACSGTGFLPLSASIRLEEEHLGFKYETVASAQKALTGGGYGTVRGEAICGPSTSGHDYRISGSIQAGTHRGVGVSKEVHLLCNV